MAIHSRPLNALPVLLFILAILPIQFSIQVHADNTGSRNSTLDEQWGHPPGLLERALPAGQCSPSQPCADQSCCANTGYCGLDPAHCGSTVCISNCNATAECGIGSQGGLQTCPLNVCCSQYGYCGTTSEFCTTGCQSYCLQPQPTQRSDGKITNLVIGYWEAWATGVTGCNGRSLRDVRTDSITHLNVAFAYITPTTFQITSIDGVLINVFGALTNLKQNAPGLKWLSLGGWTFNDNGTSTQHVFSDLASTPAKRNTFITNLVSFMVDFGFDGVDIDWEYPGAPDRGGNTDDGQNYVYLLRDIQRVFAEQNHGWGLSFTAPTSYWYMRWFEIGKMVQYVSWMNLMTYDLHGSWDSPEDYIGSYVYAHTNLTEIEDALGLLWRNGVPANKVNLGLGFYGRSYTLASPLCPIPGCPFLYAGNAGQCTKTPGVLSYAEITAYRNTYKPSVIHDPVAAVTYFPFGANQWVSYDDEQSLKAKVAWANKFGLLGLFIWALDLDDANHSALNAVLAPDGLGKFKAANGIGSGLTSTWTQVVGDQCYFAACGGSCPSAVYQTIDVVYCSSGKEQPLCCPVGNSPDPAHCAWYAGAFDFVCTDSICPSGTILIAESAWPEPGGSTKYCVVGQGKYCCDATVSGPQVCSWGTTCVAFDVNTGTTTDPNACPPGQVVASFGEQQCDSHSGLWTAICCDVGVDTSSCSWGGATPGDCSSNCGTNYIDVEWDILGGGSACGGGGGDGQGYSLFPSPWCCNANALSYTTVNLPVPLNYLFPNPGPSTDKQSVDLSIDQSEFSQDSRDPNQNAFGFMIVSGPASDVSSLNKRDGSHWDVYDCPQEHHDGKHTVKVICTNDGPESNCGELWLGGISGKVIEMPSGCGPGKYAIAVSIEPSKNQTEDGQSAPLRMRRGGGLPTVYDFTFDYDWKRAQKRTSSATLLRIDYSNDAGYWDSVINEPPSKKLKKKRQLEVEQEHGGDYKKWLEHSWHNEKRSMDMEELHARWFSADIVQWFQRQGSIDLQITGFHHEVKTTYQWWLFNYNKQCQNNGINIDSRFKMWADLNIDVSVSIGVTLIGHLADLESWDESHVWFRSKGNVDCVLNFDSYASLDFETGQFELFGLENFGADFIVPGLVTIGPNFQVFGSLAGQATLHAQAQVEIKIASWDVTQRYPSGNSPSESNAPVQNSQPVDGFGKSNPTFTYDVTATGELVAHIIPTVSLGIVWALDYLGNALIELGVDNSLRVYGSVQSNLQVPLELCYGSDGESVVYAQVTAPKMFGGEYKFYWPLNSYPFTVVEEICRTPLSTPSIE